MPGVGTTSTKDFTDAHCDNQVAKNTGSFSHSKIANGTKTNTELTNKETKTGTTASTPAVFKVTLGGVPAELEATTVSGTGTIENTEPEKEKHKITGTSKTEYTGITVKTPANCKVAEPVVVNAKFEGVEEATAGTMGLKFEPAVAGEPFATFKFENKSATEKCALNGTEIKVNGNAVGTGGAAKTAKFSGATTVFEAADEELKVGLATATFTSTITTRMKEEGGVKGNPIAGTTTPEPEL